MSPKKGLGRIPDWFRERKVRLDSDKVDALDLIINVLRKHEEELDRLIDRLDRVVRRLEERGRDP